MNQNLVKVGSNFHKNEFMIPIPILYSNILNMT